MFAKIMLTLFVLYLEYDMIKTGVAPVWLMIAIGVFYVAGMVVLTKALRQKCAQIWNAFSNHPAPHGQTMTEYALIIALIMAVVFSVLKTLGIV